ncbi:MAG: hypothetical protein ACJAUH_002036 [Saprospiraceae bacterium]|jgi:hypothetical protein
MRDKININYTFNLVGLWINRGVQANAVGVLVEAKSDKELFGKFFSSNVKVFPTNGFQIAIGVLKLANEKSFKNLLGIIDADFRRIENKVPNLPNIFLTDFHDKEMMLLSSRAWQGVLNYFANTEIDSKSGLSKLKIIENKFNKSTLEILLNIAKPVANIRLLNDRENYGLKFRTQKKKTFDYIKYDKFIDKTTLKIDKIQLQKAVENKSSKPNFFNNPILQTQLQNIEKESHDLNELCNGHDVMNIFSLALEKAIGNSASSGKVASERIEENLIIAYRMEDFQITNLYQSLLIWESVNQPYQLFPQ